MDAFRCLLNEDPSDCKAPLITDLRRELEKEPLSKLPAPFALSAEEAQLPWLDTSLHNFVHCQSLVLMMLAVQEPPVFGDGQSSGHFFVDSLINIPIYRLLKSAQSSRLMDVRRGRDVIDKTLTTTELSLRPDILITVSDCLIFRGEEEIKHFDKACTYLTKKLLWNPVLLGNLPYVFGVAVTFERIQFFALDRYEFMFSCLYVG